MNPHDLMWDSCKRSVPDVSLVKENDKPDYYYSRMGFPLSSTPPKRIDPPVKEFTPNVKNLLCQELNSIKSELEKLQRNQEKTKEYELLQSICQQLTDLRTELAQIKTQNEILANQVKNCKCKDRVENRGKNYEMLEKISEQLMDLKAEFRQKDVNNQIINVDQEIEKFDKEVQVCCLVADHATQTPVKTVQPVDYASPNFLDVRPRHQTPLVVKKPPNVPQSDLSMTANKILQKYLPDEPPPPTPIWRQTDYENLIFNMTNVSVAMQRPPQWQNTSKPRYEENSPYNNRNYIHPEPEHHLALDEAMNPWDFPPRYEEYPYRQPMEPRQNPRDFEDPEPNWRPTRQKQKLIGLSAIMNQPKLL